MISSLINHKKVINYIKFKDFQMTTETALLNIAENLPDDLKIELLHYAEYLMNKSLNTPKKPLAGSMKGTFVLPLPEDFDAPLEEFEEYM